MLVHKRTMGVLDRYWTGRYRIGPDGTGEPEMREYTLADVVGPGGDEWWEVPRNSALGRTLRRLYPFCVPVTDGEGGLLGVQDRRQTDSTGRPETTGPARARQRQRKAGLLENILLGGVKKMMTIVEVKAGSNWGHNNQTGSTQWKRGLPEGWAVFPDGPDVENFPFFEVTATEEVDGLLTVTGWVPKPIPEPEPEPEPEASDMDRLEAQVAYTAMMTDTLLEV